MSTQFTGHFPDGTERPVAIRFYGGDARGVVFEFFCQPSELEFCTLTISDEPVTRTRLLETMREFPGTKVVWP